MLTVYSTGGSLDISNENTEQCRFETMDNKRWNGISAFNSDGKRIHYHKRSKHFIHLVIREGL